MFTKSLATGLLLSGLVFSLVGTAPALAQSGLAQQSAAPQSPQKSPSKSATAKPAAKPAAAKKSPPKPLVYIEDNRSSKAADVSASKSAGASAKKASDSSASQNAQNSDVMKAFQKNCPSVALTDSKAKAGYQVTMEREPGSKGVKSAFGLANAVHKTSKIEVMNKNGKELFSETGHSTSQLVKDACTAIGTPGTKLAKN